MSTITSLFLILVLSFAVRAFTIGWHGLNDVEAQTIGIASLPDWGQLFAVCGADGNPPGYHFLLRSWAAIFGWSDISLKSLALFISSIFPPIVFFTINKRLDKQIAWQTALLAVFCPTLVAVSNMVRPHALVVIFAWLSTDQLFELFAKPNSWWQRTKYIFFIAVMMYCHMLAAGIPIAHMLYVLIAVGKKWLNREQVISWFIASVLALLLFLPFLFSILGIVNQSQHLWHVEVSPYILLLIMVYVTFNKFGTLLPLTMNKTIFALILADFVILPPSRKISYSQTDGYKWLRQFYFIGLGAYLATLCLFIYLSNTFRDRYVAHLIIFALLLFVASLRRFVCRLPAFLSFSLPLLICIPYWLPILNTLHVLADGVAYKAVRSVLRDYKENKDLFVCTWEALAPAFNRELPANFTLIAFPDLQRMTYVNFNGLEQRTKAEENFDQFKNIVAETFAKGGKVWLVTKNDYSTMSIGNRTQIKPEYNLCIVEGIVANRLQQWLFQNATVIRPTEYFQSNYNSIAETCFGAKDAKDR